MQLTHREIESLRQSPARVIHAVVNGEAIQGFEREVSDDLARGAGQSADPFRPFIPWAVLRAAGMLQRDLAVGTGTVGGNLVGSQVNDVVDALFPFSLGARMGVNFVPVEGATVGLPRTTANAAANWLANEQGTATESTPTMTSITLSPKAVGGYVEVSRQLLKQAPTLANRFVSQHMARVAGLAIDQAILAGVGTGGEPRGILNTSGVGTQAGTSLAYTGVLAMKQLAATANADDARLAFIARPAVRQTLEAREVISTSGRFVWDADRVAGKPAFASMAMPASTLICGDFSTVWCPVWGGIQIDANPFANFPSGIVGFRVLPYLDVGVTQPGAFSISTAVS
jgi:HK97 family phage major capsid protein